MLIICGWAPIGVGSALQPTALQALHFVAVPGIAASVVIALREGNRR